MSMDMRLQYDQDDSEHGFTKLMAVENTDWQQLCQQVRQTSGALGTCFAFFSDQQPAPRRVMGRRWPLLPKWTAADYQFIWQKKSFYNAISGPDLASKSYVAVPIVRGELHGLILLKYQTTAPLLNPEQRMLLDILAVQAALLWQERGEQERERQERDAQAQKGQEIGAQEGAGQEEALPARSPVPSHHLREDTSQRLLKRLKILFDHAPIPINVFNAEGRCILWNEACERVFGWSRNDIKQHPAPLNLFYPDASDQRQVKAAFYGANDSEFQEWRPYHRNGQRLTMQWANIKLPYGDTLCVGHDISDQKEIAHQQRLAANVFESSYDGIMVSDAEHCITHINPAFTRITGYSLEEVKGRYPAFLKHLSVDRELYHELCEHLKTADHWQGELTSLRKNGESYSLLLAVTVVKDEADNVLSYVAVFTDITYLKLHEAQLRHQAFHDALTGVPNRLLFGELLERAISTAERNEGQLAVCYLDLDGFKAVNDNLGHAAGDKLLIEVSRRLGLITRSCDAMSRLGGDEFALLFTALHSSLECDEILNRVQKIISQPFDLDEDIVNISASIGVALYPQDAHEAELLLRFADQAMYQAKKQGKNAYVFFDAIVHQQEQSQHQHFSQVRAGFRGDEFLLYYQPAVDLHTQSVVKLEALLRWQHPERGLLMPADFLPVIMNSPLELELGLWVIEEVLKQMSAWREQGLVFKISVNVGAGQLMHPDFTEQLSELLARYPSSLASSLELEFQESAVLADINAAVAVLQRCRGLGISMSLDNFGTGYASLNHLNQLPVDTIKIDRSFIRDLLSNAHDLSMVTSVIQLATTLKLNVMADGVERAEQGVRLQQLGCAQVQGYGISQPLPPAHIDGWLKNWANKKR
ncbi:EAL domain-containing protein [Oceanisphaera sp. IT1-181]|uniref:sensor domain-containing protein n=1 Tax=Oceanisphaera sp. IT1-181 TaxID=3081199 RepID=UPI0029CA03B3|nr:EAL domain-containing protein [Oceanisphaera sp. IT1-181]